MGKSVLVRKALHEHFASRVPHAIQVMVDTSGLFPALVHLLGIVCDVRGTRRPSASDRGCWRR